MGTHRPPRIKSNLRLRPFKASDISDGVIHAYWMDEQPVTQSGDDGYVAPDSFPTPGVPLFLPQATRILGGTVSGQDPGEPVTITEVTLSWFASTEGQDYTGEITTRTVTGKVFDPEDYSSEGSPQATVTADSGDFVGLIDSQDPAAIFAEFGAAVLDEGFDWFSYLNDRFVGPGGSLIPESYMQTVLTDQVVFKFPGHVGLQVGNQLFDILFGGL